VHESQHESAKTTERKPTTKKRKTEKLKSKNGYARSNSKQSGESMESVLKKKGRAAVGRYRKVLSLE